MKRLLEFLDVNPSGAERVQVDCYGLVICRKSTLESRRPGTDLGILKKTNLNSTMGSNNTPLDSLSFAAPQQNLLCKATWS